MTDSNVTTTNAPDAWREGRQLAPTLTRCFEIARECLSGDPFRTVPTLEVETDRLALEHQGRELTQADIDEANKIGHLPAYLVADNALGLAGELAGEVGHG